MILDFEPLTHTYREQVSRRVVVNVTRALGLLQDWSRVDKVVLENARMEGVDIHHMADLHFKNDLNEDTLPEWLRPRLAALKRVIEETGLYCFASEFRGGSDKFDYCGTMDIAGNLRVPEGRRTINVNAIIDVKRSFYGGRVIGLQTAAYQEIWNSAHPDRKATHRFALKLDGNGTYKLEPYLDRADFAHFLTTLNFYKLKEQICPAN